MTFRQIGENQVHAEHATTHGRPETLKVSVGYKDCFIGEGEISYGGSNCVARAELAAEILEKRIELTGIELEEYRTDFIGCNSLYRDAISKEIGSGTPCECASAPQAERKTGKMPFCWQTRWRLSIPTVPQEAAEQ